MKKARDASDLTIAELISRWRGGVSRGTLANWRSSGVGPRWKKIGATILYPLAEVEAYERGRTIEGDTKWFKPGKVEGAIAPPRSSRAKRTQLSKVASLGSALPINQGKTGASLPGATLNFDRLRSTRMTIGLPGSGISYSTMLQPGAARAGALPFAQFVFAVLATVAACGVLFHALR